MLLELDPVLGRAEPDPEIQELIVASGGLNVGVDFLPGALAVHAGAGRRNRTRSSPRTSSGSTRCSPTSTARRATRTCWCGTDALWLIDHGAALYLQHGAATLAAQARARRSRQIADHVLLPRAGSILEADARLAPLARRRARSSAVVGAGAGRVARAATPAATYVEYLDRRLAAPRAFAQEAERVRPAP